MSARAGRLFCPTVDNRMTSYPFGLVGIHWAVRDNVGMRIFTWWSSLILTPLVSICVYPLHKLKHQQKFHHPNIRTALLASRFKSYF